MERRTKIVATLGPASDAAEVLRKMMDAGMNMARLSLAHGPVEETLERIRMVRRVADEAGRTVGVLVDLPGPKIRAASFSTEVYLVEGDQVEVVEADAGSTSDWLRIAVDYPDIVSHLRPGDTVPLGDGADHLHLVTLDQVHLGLEGGSADLRARKVDQDPHRPTRFVRHLADQADALEGLLDRPMGQRQPGHVHACVHHPAQDLGRIRGRPYRGHDLGTSLHVLTDITGPGPGAHPRGG